MNTAILIFHEYLYNKTGLPIFMEGVDDNSYPLPVVTFSTIAYNESKEFQTETVNYDDGGVLREDYKTYAQIDIQYTLQAEGNPLSIESFLPMVGDFYFQLLRKRAQVVAGKENLGYTVLSAPVRQMAKLSDTGHIRYTMEVRYFYSTVYSGIDESGVIETANIQQNFNGEA